MEEIPFPVLDNHMHCDPRNGKGMEAVEEFARFGGTHLCMVNKPSWHLNVEVSEGDDYVGVFEETLATAEKAREILDGDVFPVLGVHPAVVSRLVERFDVERAERIMKDGLETAAEYVEEGDAVALKSGRPHYDVSDGVWEASNRVMAHAFELGNELGCAVQLHTEQADSYADIAELAEDTGMNLDRVVKHYSSPDVDDLFPSIMSNEDWIREALEDSDDFMMETDFIDDPDRPGAVLVPKTVPRRVRTFMDEYEDELRRVHVDTPEEIYGVDVEVEA
ncbi:MAG: TatD family hydrolase [Halobacteria archaeon]|nr:TatD family hydrolase [Halobacteria archaeon]